MRVLINKLFEDKFNIIMFLCLFLMGIFYVGNTFSPSSYGIILEKIEKKGEGLIFGEPRAIRSDEWAVVTPLTQATVNNDFKRYNQPSLYKEDLRINYGLPIKDWGMFFKPTMWLYLFLNPAFAYSFHWYMIFVFFILGYYFIFRKIGISKINSILLSTGLYFTGYTQFWWNEKGPIFGLFPWVILVLLWEIPTWKSLILFYWFSVAWLLTNFYPPVFLSLGFVGGLIFLIYGKRWFNIKKIILLISTAVFSAATSALYLKDYLLNTMQTVYPGHRDLSGGGVPFYMYISQFFPYINFNNKYDSLVEVNISELGVIGFYFYFLFLCFLDYKKIKIREILRDKRILILVTGLLMMTAWMLLPVPSYIGKIFLWNNVQPKRMPYASGVLSLIIVAYIFNKVEIKISYLRVGIFTLITVFSFIIFKISKGYTFKENTIDLLTM